MSWLKAAVMGGVDGVITSFAVTAGAHFTVDAKRTVAVVGLSSLVADAFSMGVSEFLSSESERSLTNRRGKPLALAVLCFGSFVLCGLVPIVAFLLTGRLEASAAFAVVEFLLLGGVQAAHTQQPLLRQTAVTTALGMTAGGIAWGVAALANEA